MQNKFIPAITGGHQCSNNDRALLGLPIRLGGLDSESVTQIAETEYESSRKRSLVESVTQRKYEKNETTVSDYSLMRSEQQRMTNKKRHSDIIQEAASSNWLSTIHLIEFNYNLSKQEFWDAIRLRYSWPITKPSIYMCMR